MQLAVSDILSKIYEPLFAPNSFGFRAGKSCHDALKALNQATFKNWNGAVVEIDIRKYFNTIPHREIMLLLSKKIVDKRFVRLIEVLIMAPVSEKGKVTPNRPDFTVAAFCRHFGKKLDWKLANNIFIFSLRVRK